MKYIAIALTSLVIGYFLRPVAEAPKAEKFETFIQNEAKKYAEATDADAKLKAADEMYGKIMLLLLAEVGTRVKPIESRPVLVKLPEVKECPPLIAPETTPKVTTATSARSDALSNRSTTPHDVAEKNWTKYTTTPYLETFKGKDRRILGRFEGTLAHKKGIDTIFMQFNLVQKGKEITGDTVVVMIDPFGKEYSRNAGNGGNRSIKADSGDFYYIEASPASYFHISLKHYPQISGKYYERGKFIGVVQLRKLDI